MSGRGVDAEQMTHSAESTTCDDHPLADLRKLTKWHEDQHPELGYLWGVERENRNLKADVERLDRQLGGELADDSVKHVLEAKCKELEAEVERLRKPGCPNCVHCILKL